MEGGLCQSNIGRVKFQWQQTSELDQLHSAVVVDVVCRWGLCYVSPPWFGNPPRAPSYPKHISPKRRYNNPHQRKLFGTDAGWRRHTQSSRRWKSFCTTLPPRTVKFNRSRDSLVFV